MSLLAMHRRCIKCLLFSLVDDYYIAALVRPTLSVVYSCSDRPFTNPITSL